MSKNSNKASNAPTAPATTVADPENDGRVEENDGMTEEIVAAVPAGAISTAVDWSSYSEEHQAQGVSLKANEVIIPMLKIVQASSKIFKDKLKPCKEGDIYNASTLEVYPSETGILIVPMDCQDCVIERKPSPDGSFIAKLKTRDPRVQEAYKLNGDDGWNKLTSKQKTQFVYTEEVPVGLIDPSNPEEVIGVAMIPFSGTNVFPRKQWWNSMASAPFANKTPRYAFRTVLKTVLRPPKTSGGIASYKYVAEPFNSTGSKNPWSDCRFRPGHPSADRCLEFLKLYQSGALGKTDYYDTDSTDHESAAEASILGDKPAF